VLHPGDGSRRHSQDTPHATGHVALVCEARRQSDLACRHVAGKKEHPCAFDPAPYNVLVCGHAEGAAEQGLQVRHAEAGDFGKGFQGQRFVEMGLDELDKLAALSRGQRLRGTNIPANRMRSGLHKTDGKRHAESLGIEARLAGSSENGQSLERNAKGVT